MMKKLLSVSAIAVAMGSSPCFSEEASGISALVCLVDEEPQTFTFITLDGAPVQLVDAENAITTHSGDTTTLILADTVYQFQNGIVQILDQGLLVKWPCVDVTTAVLEIIDRFQAAPFQAFASTAAASAMQEKLRDTQAELAAMTPALAAAEAKAEAAKIESSDKSALLSQAQKILVEKDDAILKAARDMALMNQQMMAIRGQMGIAQALLDDMSEKDKSSKVQIEALESQLHLALAQVAAAAAAEVATTETTATDAMVALDPANFDAAKIIAMIEVSELDDATKATLKVVIETAASNPEGTAAAVDAVKKALGM